MKSFTAKGRLKFALKCSSLHLLVSLILAALAACLVFKVWYPYPYAELTGGLALYTLIVAVDVVCGPLLTLILSNPAKSRKERWIDFSLVGLIQLTALLYGLYSVSLARPVAVAFEKDRFNVVTAAEIYYEANHVPSRELSWLGVERVGLREPKNAEEINKSLDLSLKGIEPSMRPDWWVEDNEESRKQVRQQMKPLSQLMASGKLNESIWSEQAKITAQVSSDRLFYLPLTSSHSKEWIVILNNQADFVGFAHVDGF